MSALCQKRTFCAAAKTSLFNHLVGGVEHRLKYGQVKRFGGFAIDSELDQRALVNPILIQRSGLADLMRP